MSWDLAGRVVLVTGPARGIGAETARQLARRGARLALVGMEPDRLRALAAELGAGHHWAECDVTDDASFARAVEASVAALGGLDVVVANAGVAHHGTVAVTPMAALARTIEVNLTGVIRTVHATLPHVTARGGYYLLVSSAAAIAPLAGLSAYAASKSGVEQFGNVLRLELAPRGVGVGVAHPSWVDTDMVRDPRSALPSFDRLLRKLPPPFGGVTSVEGCAAAFVDAIARRRRRVFVPGSLAPIAAVRGLLASAFAERAVARTVARILPTLESEVGASGAAFGKHSVGMGRSPD